MRSSLVLLLVAAGYVYAQAPTIGGCPVFPADNIWNTPIDKVPVHPDSAAYITSIGFGSWVHPDFNSVLYQGRPIGFPYITVTGTQTKYPVSFRYAAESDPGPYPVPLNAPIEGGPSSTLDRHVLTIDTTNCKLYEMFSAFPGTNSWSAGSGAVFDLRSNALRPANWTSADAAGLSLFAGLVRYDEVAAGEIRHAIRFTAPITRNRYVWPARHHASAQSDPRYPSMGQRFRLKANYDISSFPAEVQVILRAMKKYGIILADNGAPWFISGVPDSRWNNENVMTIRRVLGNAFEAVDVSSLMIDPNSGQARQTGSAVSVSVSPASASIVTSTTRSFAATVQNSTNQSVTWSVNGVAGGNAQVGYINTIGVYSAPSTVPVPSTVQVQARSAASPTTVGSASVTILPAAQAPAPTTQPPTILSRTPGGIAPGAYTLQLDGYGFAVGAVIKVGGVAIPTTRVSSYRVTGTGTLTTPGTRTVTVTNPNGQVSVPSNITVWSPSVTVSPNLVTISQRTTKQFTATVSNTTNKGVAWKVNNVVGGGAATGTISAAGLYTAPAVSTTTRFTITVTSLADPTKHAWATVTVQP